MNVEALREKIAFMSAELDHEREERNYFQLERDKVNTFWEITKKVRSHPALDAGRQVSSNTLPRRSWKIGKRSSGIREPFDYLHNLAGGVGGVGGVGGAGPEVSISGREDGGFCVGGALFSCPLWKGVAGYGGKSRDLAPPALGPNQTSARLS